MRTKILSRACALTACSLTQIRPGRVGVLPRVHGSGVFTRGETQVLSVCTLDTLVSAARIDTIWDETERALHAQLQHAAVFPARRAASRAPAAAKSAMARGPKVALEPVIPSVDEFPYAIRVVSEVSPPTAPPLRAPSAALRWR